MKHSYHTHIAKGHKESFGDEGKIYYLDCGDGMIGVCIGPNSSNYMHEICPVFYISIIPH